MKLALVLVLALPLAFVAASQSGLVGVSSPLLLWSNQALLGNGKEHSVSYQVISDTNVVAGELVLGAVGKQPVSGSRHVVSKLLNSQAMESGAVAVAFLGTQLDASDLRHASSSVASTLGGLMESAKSSVVLPYATSKAALSQEELTAQLTAAGLQFTTIACSDDSVSIDAATAAAKAGKVQAIVACSSVADADDFTNAGLESEVAQVAAIQKAVDEAGLSHVFMYASVPKDLPEHTAEGKRRSLLQVTYAGFGDYSACGTLCQTQVRWLEAMLSLVVLALASCAGMVCLYVLDTPTRFETPKEAGPSN